MRGVVVVASLLVMSSCLAGCYDEYRQNQENSSDDTRNQISAKVSIIEVYIESNTEGSSDNNNSSSEVKVDSILVLAKLAGGSSNTTVSKIFYLIICQSSEEGNQSLVLVSGALADSAPSELVDDIFGEPDFTGVRNQHRQIS